MKILLINPPLTIYRGGSNPRIHMPIGLLYIAAQLEKEGYEVEVFDALLKAKVLNDESGRRSHFGESWDAITSHIINHHPDIVGITSMFSSQSHNVKKIAQLVKDIDKNIITIVGGPHASANPHDMSNAAQVDFTIIGEGEHAMPRLLRSLKTGFNTKPDFIEDLDSLPFPAYHLYDMERYFYLQTHGYCARPLAYGKREVSIITSRGCPYNCVFCAIHATMGKKWRAHSAKHILKHIEYLVSKYKIDTIHIEDDNFSLDRARFVEITDALTNKNFSIKWDPANGLRADSLDEETITKAVKSGCQNMVIAIESGVQRVLDEIIDKKLRLDKVLEIAKICRKLKVDLYAYYVIGLPGESIKDIINTLEFAKKMLSEYFIYPQVAIASPVFGSRLYDICEKNGYFANEVNPETLGVAYNSHGTGLIKTDLFSPKDIKLLLAKYNRAFAFIMIINGLKQPRRMWKYILTIIRNPYLLKRMILNK